MSKNSSDYFFTLTVSGVFFGCIMSCEFVLVRSVNSTRAIFRQKNRKIVKPIPALLCVDFVLLIRSVVKLLRHFSPQLGSFQLVMWTAREQEEVKNYEFGWPCSAYLFWCLFFRWCRRHGTDKSSAPLTRVESENNEKLWFSAVHISPARAK